MFTLRGASAAQLSPSSYIRRWKAAQLQQPTRHSTRNKRPPRTSSATPLKTNIGGPSKRNRVLCSSTQNSRFQQAGKFVGVCDFYGTATKENQDHVVVCSGCSCGTGISCNREYHCSASSQRFKHVGPTCGVPRSSKHPHITVDFASALATSRATRSVLCKRPSITCWSCAAIGAPHALISRRLQVTVPVATRSSGFRCDGDSRIVAARNALQLPR